MNDLISRQNVDELTLTLNSPITEEQWDAITDVDFDHTDRIFFHTKHGKEVEFAKVVRCKDCVKREICRTTNIWAVAPGDDWYCADAERRTDE